MTVFVDSDVLIEVLRARDRAILEKWSALAESEDVILCSPVSVAEIWHGTRPNEHATVARLLASLACVAVDAVTGRLAGEFLREFHRSHGVELGDALIAASAAQHQAVLWTRNRKHYPMPRLSFF